MDGCHPGGAAFENGERPDILRNSGFRVRREPREKAGFHMVELTGFDFAWNITQLPKRKGFVISSDFSHPQRPSAERPLDDGRNWYIVHQ